MARRDKGSQGWKGDQANKGDKKGVPLRGKEKQGKAKGEENPEGKKPARQKAGKEPLPHAHTPEADRDLEVQARADNIEYAYLASQESGAVEGFDLSGLLQAVEKEKGRDFTEAVREKLSEGVLATLPAQTSAPHAPEKRGASKKDKGPAHKKRETVAAAQGPKWEDVRIPPELGDAGKRLFAETLGKIKQAHALAIKQNDYLNKQAYYRTIGNEARKAVSAESTREHIYYELIKIGADIDGSLQAGYSADYKPLLTHLGEQSEDIKKLSEAQKQELVRILYREADDRVHTFKREDANEQGFFVKIDSAGVSVRFATEAGADMERIMRFYFKGNDAKLRDSEREISMPFPEDFKEFIDLWKGKLFSDKGRLIGSPDKLDTGARASIESYAQAATRARVMEELFLERPESYLSELEEIFGKEVPPPSPGAGGGKPTPERGTRSRKMEGYHFISFVLTQDAAGNPVVSKRISEKTSYVLRGIPFEQKPKHYFITEPQVQISKEFPADLPDHERLSLAFNLLGHAQQLVKTEADKIPLEEKKAQGGIWDNEGFRWAADKEKNTIVVEFWTVNKKGGVKPTKIEFKLNDPTFLKRPDLEPLKEIFSQDELAGISTEWLKDREKKATLLTALRSVCYTILMSDLYHADPDSFIRELRQPPRAPGAGKAAGTVPQAGGSTVGRGPEGSRVAGSGAKPAEAVQGIKTPEQEAADLRKLYSEPGAVKIEFTNGLLIAHYQEQISPTESERKAERYAVSGVLQALPTLEKPIKQKLEKNGLSALTPEEIEKVKAQLREAIIEEQVAKALQKPEAQQKKTDAVPPGTFDDREAIAKRDAFARELTQQRAVLLDRLNYYDKEESQLRKRLEDLETQRAKISKDNPQNASLEAEAQKVDTALAELTMLRAEDVNRLEDFNRRLTELNPEPPKKTVGDLFEERKALVQRVEAAVDEMNDYYSEIQEDLKYLESHNKKDGEAQKLEKDIKALAESAKARIEKIRSKGDTKGKTTWVDPSARWEDIEKALTNLEIIAGSMKLARDLMQTLRDGFEKPALIAHAREQGLPTIAREGIHILAKNYKETTDLSQYLQKYGEELIGEARMRTIRDVVRTLADTEGKRLDLEDRLEQEVAGEKDFERLREIAQEAMDTATESAQALQNLQTLVQEVEATPVRALPTTELQLRLLEARLYGRRQQIAALREKEDAIQRQLDELDNQE